MRKFILNVVLVLTSISLTAQQKGIVRDAEGVTLPGVNIIEKGTKNGTNDIRQFSVDGLGKGLHMIRIKTGESVYTSRIVIE